MGEDECGFDDIADLAGAGGDVVEGSPAAGEDGETGCLIGVCTPIPAPSYKRLNGWHYGGSRSSPV